MSRYWDAVLNVGAAILLALFWLLLVPIGCVLFVIAFLWRDA